MKHYSLAPINRNGEQFVNVTESSYNDLGFGTQKRGLILVNPEKAQEIVEKLASGEYTTEWGAEIRGGGSINYQVVIHAGTEVEAQ